jgi:hypothetical protein
LITLLDLDQYVQMMMTYSLEHLMMISYHCLGQTFDQAL